MKPTRPLEILLVDDNPGDVDLVCSALRKGNVQTEVTVGKDGVEAVAILQDRLNEPPLPDLVLLDLNLPRKNGHDVLRQIKQDHVLKRIPVIVLTSSSAPEDIAAAYESGANCYLSKSVDFARSRKMMQLIETFWFQTVQLPS